MGGGLRYQEHQGQTVIYQRPAFHFEGGMWTLLVDCGIGTRRYVGLTMAQAWGRARRDHPIVNPYLYFDSKVI